MIVKMIQDLRNGMEKIQEMFTKDLEELKNKHTDEQQKESIAEQLRQKNGYVAWRTEWWKSLLQSTTQRKESSDCCSPNHLHIQHYPHQLSHWNFLCVGKLTNVLHVDMQMAKNIKHKLEAGSSWRVYSLGFETSPKGTIVNPTQRWCRR